MDLREARRLLAERQLAAALALCGGELLQDLDDEWVVAARDELDRDLAAALAELTQQASAAGDPAAALAWARRRAALCPLDESAGAALIEALIGAGDGPGALDAFARLEQRLGAELGVRVSARTAGLVRCLLPARLRGRRAPAAGPRPTRRQRARNPGSRRGPGGLIGRGRDLAELTRAWRAASAGAGAVVVLTGEGGIGKTRLAEQVQAAARQAEPGPLAVTATAAAGPGPAAPFAVWADALDDLTALAGPPPDQPWAADLARIVPALGYHAGGGPAAAGRAAGAAADPRLERVRLGEAVVQFLGWAARGCGVLVALEDLHLADAASLELIAYVGRRLSRLPVLLVLTRRRLPARQDLDAVLAALRARGALAAEIGLEPLPHDAARALVASTAQLPEATVRQIVALAAGSPLLLVETARAASAPDADHADLASGLAEAVRRAVGGLPGRARLFTDFAAAAGRDLDRGEVAALPLPQPALAAAEALGSGLLRTSDGRTGFRHGQLRDAVYQEIPDPVRARLHGELARLLRRPPGPGPQAGRPSGPAAGACARPRSPATCGWPGRTSRR